MVISAHKLPVIAILTALIAMIAYDGIRLGYDQRFNDSLELGDIVHINGDPDTGRQFASHYWC